MQVSLLAGNSGRTRTSENNLVWERAAIMYETVLSSSAGLLSPFSVSGKDEQMAASLERVLEAAMALSESERAELVDTLISTFAPDDAAPLDGAWLAEINRRSDDFDRGGVQTLSWAEVKERARIRRTPSE